MLVKHFQRPQEFEPTLRHIVEKLRKNPIAKHAVRSALVESLEREGQAHAAVGELCSTPSSEVVKEVITRGALTAETVHAVIDATQAYDEDVLYCMVCGGVAFCKEGCPIERRMT